jgi:phytoene dehydrogenase-like protein
MTSLKQDYDALILGAGAAGLMCAVEAGRRGRRVAVLELAERPGKKILISGGGRCNFTNIHCTPENFISSNPHFAKSALARYMPADFIALVEKHHIPYHEKTLGQLFCDRSAQDILGLLEKECAAAGVHLFTRTTVKEVLRSDQFVARADNKEFRTPVLVVATGGLSIPKIGATDFGYRLARQFGLRVCKTRPGASHLQRRRSPSVRGFGGSLHRCHRCVQRPAFPGEDAHHPSGTQRAGDPADLVVLEKGQPILVDLAPEGEITASLRRPACPRTLAALRAALQIFLPNRFPLPITIRSYSLASMVCLEQNLVAVKLSLFSREQKWITGAVTMY